MAPRVLAALHIGAIWVPSGSTQPHWELSSLRPGDSMPISCLQCPYHFFVGLGHIKVIKINALGDLTPVLQDPTLLGRGSFLYRSPPPTKGFLITPAGSSPTGLIPDGLTPAGPLPSFSSNDPLHTGLSSDSSDDDSPPSVLLDGSPPGPLPSSSPFGVLPDGLSLLVFCHARRPLAPHILARPQSHPILTPQLLTWQQSTFPPIVGCTQP